MVMELQSTHALALGWKGKLDLTIDLPDEGSIWGAVEKERKEAEQFDGCSGQAAACNAVLFGNSVRSRVLLAITARCQPQTRP